MGVGDVEQQEHGRSQCLPKGNIRGERPGLVVILSPVDVASLGYRTDLMIHGFGGSETVDRGSHLVIRTPSNPHFWWGNYLLLRSAPPAGEWQGWIAEFARKFPSARHVALGLDSVDGAVEDAEGLTALGFDIQVDTVLTATDLPRRAHKHPLFEIRPLHSDEDWAQSVELRLSLHEGAPDPRLPKRAQTRAREYRAVVEAGHGVWFGAFVDGVMRCGAGLFTDDSGLARFQSVETHPAFRRQGLASALVQRLGRWGLTDRGASKLVIVADPAYHAIELYRRLGFEDIEHQVRLARPEAV
ncbi:GNAT family N-acetyltransferase [Kineosporia sp. NBRC 101677]|uniref:GNAT family N-acetyltransferase n=1 Tax=Kineosporia sp. NBRC 101677 TaxID=3032197 RepID=UPI00255658D1|nr:GNAT family N-acetyltransferase [Kineosporia sp. NBRC 101677]